MQYASHYDCFGLLLGVTSRVDTAATLVSKSLCVLSLGFGSLVSERYVF